MNTFFRDFARFPELISVKFLRWAPRRTSAELENLSDRTLDDIGLELPRRRNLDAVKPFWMA
ncbi:MAG: DUF1127 domain-containing protein [Xanthobacteraceae bacterium]